ncbi:hypothetical protein F2Q69_00005153 [Brassica cretica]|uniref:Uncharacterized protein n=1 Tax=Brassica cretica TaxID=69181 RepID=A0A8S9PAM5_BRACR|nr:hypothetical protein F2Q69_00005153 [Brassica cretica]
MSSKKCVQEMTFAIKCDLSVLGSSKQSCVSIDRHPWRPEIDNVEAVTALVVSPIGRHLVFMGNNRAEINALALTTKPHTNRLAPMTDGEEPKRRRSISPSSRTTRSLLGEVV